MPAGNYFLPTLKRLFDNPISSPGPGVQPPDGSNRTGNGPGWAPPNQNPHHYIPGQGRYPILPYEPKSGRGLSGYHGAVWYPMPPAGTTNRAAFRPIQFPEWHAVGNGDYLVDESGRAAYAPDYYKSANLTFATPESNALWLRLPPADRIYLYSWDSPQYRSKWVQAMAEGNIGKADQIKQDYERWHRSNAQRQQYEQKLQEQARAKTPTNPAPYFAP